VLYIQSSHRRERIKIFQKAVDLINLIYDEGDCGFCYYHLCELYIWIVNCYIELKDYEKAAEYLDRGLEHAKKYDELPDKTIHISFLVRGYVFDVSNVYSGYEGNEMKRELIISTNMIFIMKFVNKLGLKRLLTNTNHLQKM
jgi:tetratricopeptide (TPR) repeat protein